MSLGQKGFFKAIRRLWEQILVDSGNYVMTAAAVIDLTLNFCG
jgi:hypothetical protein